MTTFIPKVGGFLSVTLPGELLRGEVRKVLDRNNVFVVLPQPMTKGHSYRLGDIVHARRTADPLNGQIWLVVEHRASPIAPETEDQSEKPKRKKKEAA
jgi:DNA-binding cell septation regulator SpoVG